MGSSNPCSSSSRNSSSKSLCNPDPKSPISFKRNSQIDEIPNGVVTMFRILVDSCHWYLVIDVTHETGNKFLQLSLVNTNIRIECSLTMDKAIKMDSKCPKEIKALQPFNRTLKVETLVAFVEKLRNSGFQYNALLSNCRDFVFTVLKEFASNDCTLMDNMLFWLNTSGIIFGDCLVNHYSRA